MKLSTSTTSVMASFSAGLNVGNTQAVFTAVSSLIQLEGEHLSYFFFFFSISCLSRSSEMTYASCNRIIGERRPPSVSLCFFSSNIIETISEAEGSIKFLCYCVWFLASCNSACDFVWRQKCFCVCPWGGAWGSCWTIWRSSFDFFFFLLPFVIDFTPGLVNYS